MKRMVTIACLCFFVLQTSAQKQNLASAFPDTTKEIQIVESACGQCMFGLAGAGCDLAVRIDGNAYYVDGTDIDSHGDAHGADGFCMVVRMAQVQGAVVNSRFKATYFELLPKDNQDKE